jgi:hypothetical protein
MRLLLGSCAVAALLVGGSSPVMAQVAVGEAPIHAIPASDAQSGPVISPPSAVAAQAAAPPVAPPQVEPAPAAPAQVAQLAPELPAAAPAAQSPVAQGPADQAPAAQPMVMADATITSPAPTSAENTLMASLKPAAPKPAVLSEDEAAFFTALGRRVTDAATAYDGYVRHAAAINPGFSDPASVQRAVRAGSDYQPDQLQQGVVAYAAMIALRSPAFVEGVRAQAQADPGFADRLAAQPVAVLRIPGAAQAAMDVSGVLHAHGVILQTTGKAIGKAAYDIQAQPWSKQPVSNPVQVLAGVKAEMGQPRAADAPSEKMLLQSLVAAPRSDASGSPSATPAVVRGLAIAALAIMGRAGDKEDLRVATLLHDQLAADCLKLAMMNMNQCLAAAGPHYDDVFCVGEHAVGETARCVSASVDGGGQMLPDPSLRVASAQSIGGRTYGREEASAYGYAQHPATDGDDDAAPPPRQQVAEASAYPAGDGTFDGQIDARRAQQQQQQQQEPAAAYAYQDAPPPPRPRPQARAAYPYPYGPPGGGYAPYYNNYYQSAPGSQPAPASAYDDEGYPPR